MKRFWSDASARAVDGGWEILLDGKPLYTPLRKRMQLPTQPLAEAIALEWQQAADDFQPSALPLSGLANAAIDLVARNRDEFVDPLLRYAAFDLLCYRADFPASLVARQAAIWEPVLKAAEAQHGLLFQRAAGILHVEQPQATLNKVRTLLLACSDFELAALQPLITISGSLILAIAYLDGTVSAQEAFAAATLDEQYQEENWGIDPEALRVRASREADFLTAARFLDLARSTAGRAA